jgi:hypothetical protein
VTDAGWRVAKSDITADRDPEERPPGHEGAEPLEFLPPGQAVGRRTLWDERGRIGRAARTLLVRARA